MPMPAPVKSCFWSELTIRLAPVVCCTRLAVRVVARLGEMPMTSARAASAGSAVSGTMPDRARTDR
jgi:hypothetical protein